jgi:hypothetical protein
VSPRDPVVRRRAGTHARRVSPGVLPPGVARGAHRSHELVARVARRRRSCSGRRLPCPLTLFPRHTARLSARPSTRDRPLWWSECSRRATRELFMRSGRRLQSVR